MCGLAGVFSVGEPGVDVRTLQRMIAPLRTRGPDAAGVEVLADGRAGLAHSRLSIIDLATGAQPMQDGTGEVWIAYNGEVFDYVELRARLVQRGHRFRTGSDTEVVLRAYIEFGDDFPSHLNGQFAVAIVDLRHGGRRLVLARDRVGILPLFVARDRDRLLFASEIKAMLPALGAQPTLDPRALAEIFTFWAPLGRRTAFAGIGQLPPGTILVAEHGKVTERCYWSWSFPRETDSVAPPPDRAAEEGRELLSDSVRLRLRADVPVGAYLSGGLDSAVIAALASREAGERLQTFSIRFADEAYDEGVHQARMAAHLDVAHSDLVCSGQDISHSFDDVIARTEMPVLRAAAAPMRLLSGLVRRSGFKVVLTGEGADEVFGGYDIFKETKIRRFWAQQPASRYRPMLLARLYPYLAGVGAQPLTHIRSFYGVGLEAPERFDFSHEPRWRTTTQLRRFFAPGFGEGYDPVAELEASLPPEFAQWHWFNRAQYLEATILLPNYLLNSQGDRMLMANSVEGRFPFLDHRVIEFASRLHPRLKMPVLDEKNLLKRIAADLVPAEIRQRPKQPYRTPDHLAFLADDAPEYIAELLSPDAVARVGVFDHRKVSMLTNKLRRASKASIRDEMALVGILSTQILVERMTATWAESTHQSGMVN